MILNQELQGILDGEKGDAMKRVLETIMLYGDALGAERMVPITGKMGHEVFGTGSVTWTPVFNLLQELINEGVLPQHSFSTDPRGYDPHVPANPLQKVAFHYIFSAQNRLEKEFKQLGIKDSNAYTCTAYMPEVGNIPQKGDILGWAESSAVVYVNSVLGARCNRNSGVIQMMNEILGYVPEFGFLTDDGRKADWIIEVNTSHRPDPQVLGSAIGMKVIEQVPYIKGLSRWLGNNLNQQAKDYLKDMGAASASNGAVGLYHVDGLTPEAVEMGDALIRDNAKIYVIDDAELQRIQDSYPCIWKEPEKDAQLCFIGCPHMSQDQILFWTEKVANGLKAAGKTRVCVPTVFTAAPDVAAAFRSNHPDKDKQLHKMGVVLSSICPLSYTSNPLVESVRIITCSNKLRYYSHARFYNEDEIIDQITKGGK